MRVRQIFIGAAVTVALISASVPAFAGHTWSTYHIARIDNPIALKIVDSVTPEWQAELDQSIVEWNKADVLDLRIDSADDSSRTRKRCNGQWPDACL